MTESSTSLFSGQRPSLALLRQACCGMQSQHLEERQHKAEGLQVWRPDCQKRHNEALGVLQTLWLVEKQGRWEAHLILVLNNMHAYGDESHVDDTCNAQ